MNQGIRAFSWELEEGAVWVTSNLPNCCNHTLCRKLSLCIMLVLSCAVACYSWKCFTSSCIFSVLMLSFLDLVKLVTHDVRLNCRCTGVLQEAAGFRLSPQRCTWFLLSSGCIPVLGVTAWQCRLSVGLQQTQLFSKGARQRSELSVAHSVLHCWDLLTTVISLAINSFQSSPSWWKLNLVGFGCCGLAYRRLVVFC